MSHANIYDTIDVPSEFDFSTIILFQQSLQNSTNSSHDWSISILVIKYSVIFTIFASYHIMQCE